MTYGIEWSGCRAAAARPRAWLSWSLSALLCIACSKEKGGAGGGDHTETANHPDTAEDAEVEEDAGSGEEEEGDHDAGRSEDSGRDHAAARNEDSGRADDAASASDAGQSNDADSNDAGGNDAGNPGSDAATNTMDAGGSDSGLDAATADAALDAQVTVDSGRADTGVDSGPPIVLPATIAKPNDRADYLFDATKVRTYNIIIADRDLRALDADPAAEVYVPASLEFEGTRIDNLRVRYKGGYGAFLAPCTGGDLLGVSIAKTGKCSIKLAFDQVDSEGRFYGLRKLNFHSMNRDRSMLRDRLGYSLFRDSELVAPRAAHARVLINGRLEGLFALVEQVDGRFTRSRFGEGGEGNLYKEIWPIHAERKAYLDALETNEDESPSVDGMLDFRAAIERGSSATETFINRDYLMKYVAIDRTIINDDGVFHWWCVSDGAGANPGGVGNHNYYWYQERARSFFWLIPWDFDNAFNASASVVVWPEWRASATCTCASTPTSLIPQRPASCDRLTQHFISWLSDFNRHTEAFVSGPFAAAAVNAKLDAWVAQIRPHVAEAAGRLGAPSESDWEAAVRALRTTVDAARSNRGYRY